MAVIRFMGEEGVDVPLWGDEGLIYDDSEEFFAALGPFGLSAELAADVVSGRGIGRHGVAHPSTTLRLLG